MGFFGTIKHTFELMKMSWRVLMKDRELIFFPLMAAGAIIATLAVFGGIAASTGTLDRLNSETGEATTNAGDTILYIAAFFTVTFIGIFFNSALIAAALERLRGGDPNVSSGLRKAATHVHTILAWAIIAATVGLLLQLLRNLARERFGFLGQIAVSLVGGVWAYLTFFVIPVLVAEGLGPIAAFKRSKSMFTQTWGQQASSSFGFGLVYVLAAVAAFVPTFVLFIVHPILGVAGGAIFFSIALGGVAAMEGIFKAALYEFANGESPQEFDRQTLSSAYGDLPRSYSSRM